MKNDDSLKRIKAMAEALAKHQKAQADEKAMEAKEETEDDDMDLAAEYAGWRPLTFSMKLAICFTKRQLFSKARTLKQPAASRAALWRCTAMMEL